jgi:hypothetical protein
LVGKKEEEEDVSVLERVCMTNVKAELKGRGGDDLGMEG